MNYEFVNASHGDDWDILWTVESIFQDDHPLFADALKKPFKIYQKINHFEGIGGMVSKTWMNHLNRGEKFVLPSFWLTGLENLKKFIAKNPHKKVLQKNYFNRGVKIVDAKDIVPDPEREIFYQEFMDNPFLIDGHAFDFGVFVLITSFDPVRIYRYDADVLLRFCSEKYHPFDPKIREKYVVAGESKTVYEMPSFKDIYKTYGFPSRIMFENHISERGHDVKAFWQRIDAAIAQISLNAEKFVIEGLKNLRHSSINFFELVRFDIILDADLNPYVVEVNMSPNITPAGQKYEENILIYEQMVHNVVKMIGGGSYHEFWGRYGFLSLALT
jgi:tubulin monoglycylase TTLL15